MKLKDIVVDYTSQDCTIDYLMKKSYQIASILKESGSKVPVNDIIPFFESMAKDESMTKEKNLSSLKFYFEHDFGYYVTIRK